MPAPQSTTFNSPEPPRLHLAAASASWDLLMQSGVEIRCTVGLPLNDLMHDQLGLSCAQMDLAEALILDGMPVDDPTTAIVPNGARLALAAGLPGIAGLAMKRDSAVKVLRATITYFEHEHAPANPQPGHITMCLYSLVMPLLAPHFLRRGVIITLNQLERYARFAPGDLGQVDQRCLTVSDYVEELRQSATAPSKIFFTAELPPPEASTPAKPQ